MSIGTSLGAYFDSPMDFHLDAHDNNVISPTQEQMQDHGIEVSPDTLQDRKIFTPEVIKASDIKDSGDYDYDSWQRANPGVEMAPGQHYPDTYKLPNHMTFSDESIYNKDGNQGGHWGNENGKDTFTPGPTNLKYHSVDELKDYFSRVEPDVILDLSHVNK